MRSHLRKRPWTWCAHWQETQRATLLRHGPPPDPPDLSDPPDPHDLPSPSPTTSEAEVVLPEEGQEREPRTNEESDAAVQDTSIECPVCQQRFHNQYSLAGHFPSHPVEANLARLLPRHQETEVTDANQVIEPLTENQDQLRQDCEQWYRAFDEMYHNLLNFNFDEFNRLYSKFASFLFEANQRLPGPVHPAVKWFRYRKKQKEGRTENPDRRATNEARANQKRRKYRRGNYLRELTQHEFYNCRKKAARRVLSPKTDQERCTIPMDALEEHFRSVLSSPNDHILPSYPSREPSDDIEVTLADVKTAVRAVHMDTSPAHDRVLARTIKTLPVANSIKRIIDIILVTGQIPNKLQEGKTILIPKAGDKSSISSWRPVTMYSIVRRVVERVLDKKLREQVELNPNQRGFVAGLPGCQINSRLVNACLQHAKRAKKDCTVAFLDVSKAFDRVGHLHIEKCLESQGVARNLKKVIMALLTNNKIHLHLGNQRSAPIQVNRSVPQGGPLSPLLFNLAINFIYDELCHGQIADRNGYKIADDLPPLSLTGFADDQAVTAKSEEGARRLIELVQDLLSTIGLDVNPSKSTAIRVQKGKLCPGTLELPNGEIKCIDASTKIKYLGCTFTNLLVFDSSIVGKITEQMNNLIKSPLLRKDQKLAVLNQYIMPQLTYPLQAAPRNQIPKGDLQVLDVNIRRTVKAIIGLPSSTATAMIYSPRKFRGLGAVCLQWEAVLQHFSMARRLSRIQDCLLQRSYDFEEEARQCQDELGVRGETATEMRQALRMKAFQDWADCDWQGIGVKHFLTCPQANRFMTSTTTLSCSEWTAAIKLTTNYASLAGVPGAPGADSRSSKLCRRCRQDNETPKHVLGGCAFGALRRNLRHDTVKNKISSLLKQKGFEVVEEAQCQDDLGTNRRVDVLAFDQRTKNA